MYICRYCNRECKNKNSLMNHERLCKQNPNRQYTKFSDLEFQRNKTVTGGINQYIKAERMGLPKPQISEETKIKLSNNMLSRSDEWHSENGKRISNSIKRKVIEGTWHTSLARNMNIDYNGITLHGTWEVKYAQFLDQNNIEWIRCKESFSYIFENKERRYTPDFYLPETDEYIEIKGYKTNKDEAKWNSFPKHRKLKVLLAKDLKELGILL